MVSWGDEQDKDHLDTGTYMPEISWEEVKGMGYVNAIFERGMPVPYEDAKSEAFTAAYGVYVVVNGTTYQLVLQDIVTTTWGNEYTNISTLSNIKQVGVGLTSNYEYVQKTNGSYGTTSTSYQITKKWPEWFSYAKTALADLDGQGNTDKLITAQGSSADYLGKTITKFWSNTEVNEDYTDCPSAAQMAFIYLNKT